MIKNIVWIEDDIEVIGKLFDIFRRQGHIVHEIRSRHEALEKTELLRAADLIVIDLILPEGGGGYSNTSKQPMHYTGLELLKLIRKDELIHAPIVVLTVVSRPEVLKDIEDSGVKEEFILQKPILPSELKNVVDEALQNTN